MRLRKRRKSSCFMSSLSSAGGWEVGFVWRAVERSGQVRGVEALGPTREACCSRKVRQVGIWREWATGRPAGRTWRHSTRRRLWTLVGDENDDEDKLQCEQERNKAARDHPAHLSGWSAAAWPSRWVDWCLRWPGSWSLRPSLWASSLRRW